MSIRLIVADLDNTLLNSDHEVSPFTDQMIRAALARGVYFTVATGKTFPSTPQITAQFGITIPVICGNGTQVFMPDGTPIYEDPIPLDLALEAVQMGAARGFTPVVYTATGLLAPGHDANVQELIAHHEPTPDYDPNIAAALRNGHKPYKLILMSQNYDAVDRFTVDLNQRFAGRAQVIRSGLQSVVEVLPLSASKGNALKIILDRLNITPGETMCLGDNCNDVDMLQLAGIGVAMGQAPLDVRAVADYVTGTNDEDGVGHAIKKFVLESVGA
ncbi:MAG: HAD family hydrolase [Anaerolineae bacterium]|nr:HAD family hydrolase [Anaerolineae bacterium]